MKKIIAFLLSLLMTVSMAVPVFANERTRTVDEIVNDLKVCLNDSRLYHDHSGLYFYASEELESLLKELGTDGLKFTGDKGYHHGSNINLGDEIEKTDDGRYHVMLDMVDSIEHGVPETGEVISVNVVVNQNIYLIKELTAPDMNMYTITLNPMGGSFPEGTKNSVNIGVDEHVISANGPGFIPVKEGCTFAGWYGETEYIHKFDYFTYDIVENYKSTLYAKWIIDNPRTAHVTLDAQGGFLVNEFVSITEGDIHDLYISNIPVRNGYTFLGWYSEPEGINRLDNLTYEIAENSNFLIYAVWKEGEAVKKNLSDYCDVKLTDNNFVLSFKDEQAKNEVGDNGFSYKIYLNDVFLGSRYNTVDYSLLSSYKLSYKAATLCNNETGNILKFEVAFDGFYLETFEVNVDNFVKTVSMDDINIIWDGENISLESDNVDKLKDVWSILLYDGNISKDTLIDLKMDSYSGDLLFIDRYYSYPEKVLTVPFASDYAEDHGINPEWLNDGAIMLVLFKQGKSAPISFELHHEILASFDINKGLTIDCADNKKMFESMINGVYYDASNNKLSGSVYYDTIDLELISSDYSAVAHITNCVIDIGGEKITNDYIVRIDASRAGISIDSLKELGLVNGMYKISLSSKGGKTDALYLGNLRISGMKSIDSTNDRVDTLYIDLGDDFKKPAVGEEIPDNIAADIYTYVDGKKVAVNNVRLEWARKAAYKLGNNQDWFTSASQEVYYDSNNEYVYLNRPNFDANTNYYLSVEYRPYLKDYDNNFKLIINGKEQNINNHYIGKGAGGGFSYFYIETTEQEYCTTIPYGYAAAKIDAPDGFTTKDNTIAKSKIDNMFQKSASDGSVEDTNKLIYKNVANDASGSGTASNISAVVGEGGKIEISLRQSTVEKVDGNVVVTKMSFDVTPLTVDNVPKHGNVGKTVTFRLPVDDDANYKYANVEHEGSFLQQCEVKSDANGKYIEVSSSEFSVFSYSLTNTEYVAPSVDNGGSNWVYIPKHKPVVNTAAK